MTNQEILDAIAVSPDLQALVAQRDVKGIADSLSAGRTKVVSHFASERGILERFPLGPLAADAMLTKLEVFGATAHPMASIVKRALKFLAQPEGLDLGSPAVQALLGSLAAGGVITAQELAGVVAMATAADPISPATVSAAVFNDNGTLKG